jgi:hypothetical protein
MKGFPHGIGMQTLNSSNLTPVQDGPDREDHKHVKKSDEKRKEREKLKKGGTPKKIVNF